MTEQILIFVFTVLSGALGGGIAYYVVRRSADSVLRDARQSAETIFEATRKEADALKKTAVVEGRESLRQEREKNEKIRREAAEEMKKREQRVDQKEDEVDKTRKQIVERQEALERRSQELETKEEVLVKKTEAIDQRVDDLDNQLARVAQLTIDEAKREFLGRVEERYQLEAAKLGRQIEETAKEDAEQKAKHIIALCVQRYAGEYIAERTVTIVQIPNDQMKGRIIGREGRNIRAFEMIVGVDLIVDDTPDTVVISCHNPLRRHLARVTLEKLIEDGRIQPGRIEEVYQAVAQETEKEIRDAGQQAVFDLGLQGLNPELVRLMGINQFRTSFAQNILHHSVEVAYMCGMMADELGLDRQLARRCGFLHDIGKAVDHEFEGGHAHIGADLCKKYGEHEDVIQAVGEHHDDPPSTIYGVLVQAADALSAARPGARREMLANFIKRLEDLEEIAGRHPEVERSYAIQSGRELRVAIKAEGTDDNAAYVIAKSIAAEIESEMNYPGQIKVTVLRETRSTAFAK